MMLTCIEKLRTLDINLCITKCEKEKSRQAGRKALSQRMQQDLAYHQPLAANSSLLTTWRSEETVQSHRSGGHRLVLLSFSRSFGRSGFWTIYSRNHTQHLQRR